MKNKHYILKKDLPGCPSGRLFKEVDHGGSIFHKMTDKEYLSHQFMDYTFPVHILETNPDWFELCEDTKAAEKELRRKEWEKLDKEFGNKQKDESYPMHGTWRDKILFVLKNKICHLKPMEIALMLNLYERKPGTLTLDACRQVLPKMTEEGLLTRYEIGCGWEYKINGYR